MSTATSTLPKGKLAAGLAIGAAVAIALGVYGNVHDPTGRSLVTLFFTATINLKVWLATAAIAFAVFQLLSGMKMHGKLGGGFGPKWLGRAHRASGTLAFLFTIPVAYHCLWALGFRADAGPRVLTHSLAGCVFFGAIATKVFFVRSRRVPRWALPLAGGAVFTALVAVWTTSALWFFTTVEFPGF